MHEPVLRRLFSLNERELLTILTSTIGQNTYLAQLHAKEPAFDEIRKKLQSWKAGSPRKTKPGIPMEDRIVQATDQTTVSSLCYSCPEEALLSALSQRADLLDNTVVQMRIAQSTPRFITKFLLDEAHRNFAGPVISLLSPYRFLNVISGNSLQMLPAAQTRLGMMEPDEVHKFMNHERNFPFISHYLVQPMLRSILLEPFDTSLQKKIKMLIKEPNETKNSSRKADPRHDRAEHPSREYAFHRSHYQSAPLNEIGQNDLYVLIDEIRYNFSDNNPDEESSQFFEKKKPAFFYSKDNKGNYWINIADPRNAYIVRLFVETHNHTACMQLAATFPIAMQHLISGLVASISPTQALYGHTSLLVEPSHRIDDGMLDKIAPYISDTNLSILLMSPCGTQYLDNRNLRTRVLSKTFSQELGKLPKEIFKRLSFLRPLSFGRVLPSVIDQMRPDFAIFNYSLWALLELFKHANSEVIRSIQSVQSKLIISKLIQKLMHHGMPLDDNTLSYVVSNISDGELFDMLSSSSFNTLFSNNTVRKRTLSANFVDHYLWRLQNTKIKRILLTDGPHLLQCKQLLYTKSFSKRQFYQLLMLNETEILLVDKDILAHCLSKHFARKHLKKLPVAKLAFIFNNYFEETEPIIPDFLKKCDGEKCASLMALSDNFFDHELVRARCLKDDSVTKHLSRLPDTQIIRLLEAHQEAYRNPTFQKRVLSMQDERCIEQLVDLSARDTLLETVKSMVDEHNRSQMLPHPLENPLVQRRFLEDDLVENFTEFAPTNLFIRAVFSRPSLWSRQFIKGQILYLAKRVDSLPDITAIEIEWLEIMDNYLSHIEPLVREYRTRFAQNECKIDDIMQELKDGRRWNLLMKILTLFHDTMHYESTAQDLSDLTAQAPSGLTDHQSNLEVLGNFACLCLALCTETDFARAVLCKQKFHYLCAVLQSTELNQLIELAKRFITEGSDETARKLAPLEPASSQMAYVAGILAYDVYNQDHTQFLADLAHVKEQLDREQEMRNTSKFSHNLWASASRKQPVLAQHMKKFDQKLQEQIREEQETLRTLYSKRTSLHMMYGIYRLLAHAQDQEEANQMKVIMDAGWKAAITLSGNDDDSDSSFEDLFSRFPESIDIDKEFMKEVWKNMSEVPGFWSENSPLSKLVALKMATDKPTNLTQAVREHYYVIQVAYALYKEKGYKIDLDQPPYDIVTPTHAILCKYLDWELLSKDTMDTFKKQLQEHRLAAQQQKKVFVLYSPNIPQETKDSLYEEGITVVRSD